MMMRQLIWNLSGSKPSAFMSPQVSDAVDWMTSLVKTSSVSIHLHVFSRLLQTKGSPRYLDCLCS